MSPRCVRGALALGLLLTSLSLLPAGPATPSAVAAATGDGWSATKTLTRNYFVNSRSVADPNDPTKTTVEGDPATDSRTVTVRVDKHTDLQARERIHVTWSGAHPSGGRTANPFGEQGLNQEYPVLLLQCRGLDDPSLPADEQVRTLDLLDQHGRPTDAVG